MNLDFMIPKKSIEGRLTTMEFSGNNWHIIVQDDNPGVNKESYPCFFIPRLSENIEMDKKVRIDYSLISFVRNYHGMKYKKALSVKPLESSW